MVKENNNKKTKIKKVNIKNVRNTSKTKISNNSLLDSKEYKIAEKLYKSKDYENAYDKYHELSSKFKKNKKIYKRLLECLTKDYTYKENNKEFKRAIDDYITTYKILATKRELKYLENRLNEYKKVKPVNSKSKFLLIAFLGYFGIHKFIDKKYILGILYLVTLGFYGVGVIYDLINDYAEYENDTQLNIFRYIISLIIFIIGLLLMKSYANFYYFILISLLITPFIYNKVLKLIPNIIKIIAIIILLYFGFKTEPVIEHVPTNILGKWFTDNESTNYKELNIKLDKTTIKFSDREKIVGINTFDKENNILSVYVNEKSTYKFRIDFENNQICTYNESKKCLISFKK